jgi:hypothetical protein
MAVEYSPPAQMCASLPRGVTGGGGEKSPEWREIAGRRERNLERDRQTAGLELGNDGKRTKS